MAFAPPHKECLFQVTGAAAVAAGVLDVLLQSLSGCRATLFAGEPTLRTLAAFSELPCTEGEFSLFRRSPNPNAFATAWPCFTAARISDGSLAATGNCCSLD